MWIVVDNDHARWVVMCVLNNGTLFFLTPQFFATNALSRAERYAFIEDAQAAANVERANKIWRGQFQWQVATVAEAKKKYLS